MDVALSLLDPVPTLWAAGLLLVAVLAICVFAAMAFDRYRNNLPLLALAESLDGRIADRRQRLEDLDALIADREAFLPEAERLKAEAGHWREQVDLLRAEYDGLGAARAEVAQVREEARKSLEDLALAETRRAEAEARAATAAQGVEVAERRAAAANAAAGAAEDRASALRSAAEKPAGELAELRPKLEEVRRTLSDADRAREAAEAADRARLAAEAATSAAAARVDELKAMADATAGLYAERRAELDGAMARIAAATEADRRLNAAQAEEAAIRFRLAELGDALEQARDARDLLLAEKEKLERDVIGLAARRGGGPAGGVAASAPEDAFADLRTTPDCLIAFGDAEPRRPADEGLDENAMLHRVAEHLKACGLTFPKRTLNAFHTSIKINDMAQLTVLAGVSGTGKSQLPRRYAEAMGLHFLQVPIQPRWDGPQDLLGFYNYLEQRYRATDFVRALAHMDTTNFPDIARPDRMLLVLLDEMNLARVEYYFSEFLSRLEARPPSGAPAQAQRDAATLLEAPGVAQRLYAGHNILFVGTMNEDESTQSLSDKVLDRANQMRFPKPERLAPRHTKEMPRGAERPLSYSSWRSWRKGALSATEARVIDETLLKLNKGFSKVGRGFGHRLRQAIEAYVCEYPRGGAEAPIKTALADQIEMRLLPRLRGLQVEEEATADLLELLAGECSTLEDEPLATAINASSEASRASGGLFTWQGVGRG